MDGFYYPGVLRVNINPRYADVSFCDLESQVVSLRHIIPNEGSRPCPSLKVFGACKSMNGNFDFFSFVSLFNN